VDAPYFKVVQAQKAKVVIAIRAVIIVGVLKVQRSLGKRLHR
jgi:hypothetical protein